MLVVRVELWSAVDGRKEELGRMYIANDGTSDDPAVGHYKVKVCRKNARRAFLGWDEVSAVREGRVEDHARLSYGIWKLVHKALRACYPEDV